MIDRRVVLGAAPAALALPAVGAPSDLAVRGSSAYSESAMVMAIDPAGTTALTLRFCRFPVEGQTWLWCHVLHAGRFFAFTRHDLPCTADRLAATPEAAYRTAAPATAELVRVRREGRLPDIRFAADLGFHESRHAPHGPGATRGRITGVFRGSSALDAQVLEGREEVYGLCEAQVQIGRTRFVLRGPSKFHEQRQAAPRFDAPFCYGWLWGEGANATTLLHAKGASGGWRLDGAEAPLTDMVLDPPGDVRNVTWRFRDRASVTGRLEALVRYEIPVFDRRWQGSFVRGAGPGRRVVGVMNDWLADPDIYAAARLRNGL